MVEKPARTLLLADAALVRLVGDRIAPLFSGQDQPAPRVGHLRSATEREQNLDGPTALCKPRVRWDCIAATEAEAVAIAHRVRVVLNGYPKAGQTQTVGGLRLRRFRVVDEFDQPEPPADATGRPWFVRSLEIEMAFDEPTT